MIATTNRNAHDGGWLVRATRRLAFALALVALCFAPAQKPTRSAPASAPLRAMTTFARRRFSCRSRAGLAGRPDLSRLYVSIRSWRSPRLCPRHELAASGGRTGRADGTIPARPSVRQRLWRAAGLGCRPKSGSILQRPTRGQGNRNISARVRDAVAQKLTLNQLAEAQRRAAAWTPIASPNLGPFSARY